MINDQLRALRALVVPSVRAETMTVTRAFGCSAWGVQLREGERALFTCPS